MACNGRGGARFSIALTLGWACSLQSAALAQNAVDPFLPAGVVPTPIVPQLSQTAERAAAKQAAPIAKPPAIGPGELVPIIDPRTPATSAKQPVREPAKSKPTRVSDDLDVAKQKKPDADETLVPIRPASAARDSTPPAMKGKKSKSSPAATTPTMKASVKTEPVKKPEVRVEPAPTTFTFPQPPIPLESALRKLLGFVQQRR